MKKSPDFLKRPFYRFKFLYTTTNKSLQSFANDMKSTRIMTLKNFINDVRGEGRMRIRNGQIFTEILSPIKVFFFLHLAIAGKTHCSRKKSKKHFISSQNDIPGSLLMNQIEIERVVVIQCIEVQKN